MLLPNSFCLVHSQTELEYVVGQLGSARELAVDTESDNLHAFRPKLCLIQIATDSDIFLIDGLSPELNLQLLAPVFENPHITKYFHSATGDLSFLLSQQLHVLGLFDTQRAAIYLQKPKLGLAPLTQDYLGISLDKSCQKANFAKRPLSDEILLYAASDVRFLLQLGRILKNECMQKNLLEEVLLDCLRIENEAKIPLEPAEGFVFRPSPLLTPRQQHLAVKIAHCLHAARLRWAKRKKRPFGQILSNQSLYAVAYAAPTSLEELQKLPGMQKNVVAQFGPWILKQIDEIQQSKLNLLENAIPPQKEVPPEIQKRIDALRKFRMQEAMAHQLSPQQILNNALIERLAENPPPNLEALLRFPYFGNKRFHLYGPRILEFLDDPSLAYGPTPLP
ncbi:MAG: HRDC domain-containing protein [Cystobacterineae bacterium]|nr:HRDC domain-containing protein [Cystobacterineae bacterium]